MNSDAVVEIASVPQPDAALGDELVRLQKAVWGSEPDDVLPSWRFVVTPRTGGELLVARVDGALIGFALCSPGVSSGPVSDGPVEGSRVDTAQVYLYLDLLGVLPTYRHARVGERLMRALVDVATRRKIRAIRWTFDPLEGANANLYLAKLGARGVAFWPDLYGSMARAGQAGERSDRLLAELHVESRAGATRGHAERPVVVLEPNSPLPRPLPARLAIAVPADYARLRVEQPSQARAVRAGVGRLLGELCAHGFAITDLVRGADQNHLVAERVAGADAPTDA